MKPKKILVIGLGSSAGRFGQILAEKKHSVVYFKHKPNAVIPHGSEFTLNLNNCEDYDGAIIASPTASHYEYDKHLLAKQLPILVEKPISITLTQARRLLALSKRNNTSLMTGLNWRYLPIIELIRQKIEQGDLGKIIRAEFTLGQYLPFWRPQADYKETYSAKFELGGGVALDLIHDLDLALHFFPHLKLKPIFSDRLGKLSMNAENLALFINSNTDSPLVTVELDMLNHINTHQLRIIGESGSLHCDIVNKRMTMIDDNNRLTTITDPIQFDRLASFSLLIDAFMSKIDKQTVDQDERSLGIDALAIALKARKKIPYV